MPILQEIWPLVLLKADTSDHIPQLLSSRHYSYIPIPNRGDKKTAKCAQTKGSNEKECGSTIEKTVTTM